MKHLYEPFNEIHWRHVAQEVLGTVLLVAVVVWAAML